MVKKTTEISDNYVQNPRQFQIASPNIPKHNARMTENFDHPSPKRPRTKPSDFVVDHDVLQISSGTEITNFLEDIEDPFAEEYVKIEVTDQESGQNISNQREDFFVGASTVITSYQPQSSSKEDVKRCKICKVKLHIKTDFGEDSCPECKVNRFIE